MTSDQDAPSFFDEADERSGHDVRALPEGYRIGEFEIRGVLGSGSFAIVYKAYDHSLSQLRAIKEFLPRGLAARFDNNAVTILSKKDETAYSNGLARFVAEARLLAGINHPSVVRVYRCIETNRTAYMVMDLCEGETLEQRLLRDPTIDEAWLRDFLASLLGGLDALHAKRVLHRDIKPSNIFLVDGTRPVLIDFGSARQLAEGEGRQEMTAIVTFNYSAPEQWDSTGQFEQGPYSDIYSLGATAYELVAQRKPNASNTRLLRDTLIPAIDVAKGRYSPKLLATIDKALKISVTERYQTARQWLEELQKAAPAAGDKRGASPVLIAVGIIALLTIGAGTFFALRKHGAADTPAVAPAAPIATPGSLIRDCPSCPEMVVVGKGEFQQGASGNTADRDELPKHAVKITYDFAVSRFEISRAQFREFVNASGYNFGGDPGCGKKKSDGSDRTWKDPGFAQRDDEPVVCVSWFDARAYADWLTRITGKPYRSLSESEWEYVARAGHDGIAPWAEDLAGACAFANLGDESYNQRTGAKVATKCNDQFALTAPASTALRQYRLGVHDMLGNVAEWVADCQSDDYIGAPTNGSASDSATCQRRVYRGGAFNYPVADVRYSRREFMPPGERKPFVGFRIARSIEQPAAAAPEAKP
jgi:formylglycine-generating enzyme required for sulfatase activity